MHDESGDVIEESFHGPLVLQLLEGFYTSSDPDEWRGSADFFEHRAPDGTDAISSLGQFKVNHSGRLMKLGKTTLFAIPSRRGRTTGSPPVNRDRPHNRHIYRPDSRDAAPPPR